MLEIKGMVKKLFFGFVSEIKWHFDFSKLSSRQKVPPNISLFSDNFGDSINCRVSALECVKIAGCKRQRERGNVTCHVSSPLAVVRVSEALFYSTQCSFLFHPNPEFNEYECEGAPKKYNKFWAGTVERFHFMISAEKSRFFFDGRW